MTPDDLHDRVRQLLDEAGCDYELREHAPIESAAHAAELRGTPLEQGAKAILMKLYDDRGFVIVATCGDRRFEGKAVRRHFGVQRHRFARRAELDDLVGAPPGGVPPFGRPVVDLPLYVDAALADQPRIYFTAGRRDRSFAMACDDWLAVAEPDGVYPLS